MSVHPVVNHTNHKGIVYEGCFGSRTLIVRWATHEDYDNVMKINENGYGGGDYLPSTYHLTIDEPTAHSFIAELDEEVVAFVCYWIDGLTNTITTSTAGRVHVDYRHQGLYTQFTNVVELEMKKMYPILFFDWSISVVSEKLVQRFQLAGGRLIYEKFHIFATMSLEEIQRGKGLQNLDVNIYTPSASEITDLLSNLNVLKYLYPKGVFVHADRYRPYPISEYFINNQIKSGPVIISGALETHDLALSIVNVQSCPVGVRLSISYDGRPDARIIQAHTLKAAESMARRCMEVAEQRRETMSEEKEQGKSDEPKLRLGILFPSLADPDSVWQFTRETFRCEYQEKSYARFGLFQKPYK